MIELPDTKEIMSILLLYGESIKMTLVNYSHSIYARKITALYYVTDGLRETYKTICIYSTDNNILVQIDEDILSYTNFKKRYQALWVTM